MAASLVHVQPARSNACSLNDNFKVSFSSYVLLNSESHKVTRFKLVFESKFL